MTNIVDPTATAVDQPTVGMMMVTPETAERWLKRNTSNRPIRSSHVDVLARDMSNGHWQMTGEAIKFDSDGNLIDGQHRLSAIVQSGQTVNLIVISGLASESQQAMDAGARRSASDALSFAGKHNTASLAHAARMALAWERGEIRTVGSNIPQVSNSEVVAYVDLNPGLALAHEGMSVYRQRGRSVGVAVCARHILRQIDADAADEMFQRIIDNHTHGVGDPVNALLNRFTSSRINREALNHPTELHMLFRTWNALRTSEALHRIQVSSGQTVCIPA